MIRKVLVFAGSARKASYNKQFAAAAADYAREAGAEVTLIDLADYEAPIFNEDIESATGLPQPIKDLKALVATHDAMIISTPEYNGHVPPLLVNTFGWVSRNDGDEATDDAFKGKKAAIMAASPGGLGGIRVVPRLRDSLAELGIVCVPGFATLPGAYEAFNEDGSLKNEKHAATLNGLVERLLAAI